MFVNIMLPLLRLLKSSMYHNPLDLIKSHKLTKEKVKDKEHLKLACLVQVGPYLQPTWIIEFATKDAAYVVIEVM